MCRLGQLLVTVCTLGAIFLALKHQFEDRILGWQLLATIGTSLCAVAFVWGVCKGYWRDLEETDRENEKAQDYREEDWNP